MEQVIGAIGVDSRECFFWDVRTGAEIDLVIERGGCLHGFEFKRSLSPKFSRSMRSAIETLDLSDLTVVYPGEHTFALAENVVVKPLAEFT
jgi:predicted AAA+ superfamily ATPase